MVLKMDPAARPPVTSISRNPWVANAAFPSTAPSPSCSSAMSVSPTTAGGCDTSGGVGTGGFCLGSPTRQLTKESSRSAIGISFSTTCGDQFGPDSSTATTSGSGRGAPSATSSGSQATCYTVTGSYAAASTSSYTAASYVSSMGDAVGGEGADDRAETMVTANPPGRPSSKVTSGYGGQCVLSRPSLYKDQMARLLGHRELCEPPNSAALRGNTYARQVRCPPGTALGGS